VGTFACGSAPWCMSVCMDGLRGLDAGRGKVYRGMDTVAFLPDFGPEVVKTNMMQQQNFLAMQCSDLQMILFLPNTLTIERKRVPFHTNAMMSSLSRHHHHHLNSNPTHSISVYLPNQRPQCPNPAPSARPPAPSSCAAKSTNHRNGTLCARARAGKASRAGSRMRRGWRGDFRGIDTGVW
jgi:hypothetical protein